ncbi:hypothetical protein RhiirA1_501316 [Rhizophagus irregularis]|uniref:Uncharacterized protein n=1 Tax=Rhizophagus irregularis TaxID=588596 RepID=A0A2N0S4H9_9GLOM|nr:hypothetical protein RhiirA1_501316 [Rhizophagus irregularis]
MRNQLKIRANNNGGNRHGQNNFSKADFKGKTIEKFEANSHLNITFHSNKSYNFHIPNNIDDFDKLNNQKNSSKIISIFKDIQETMQQQIKKYHDDIDDDEIHNNPNLHSEEQDELELPDSNYSLFLNLKF